MIVLGALVTLSDAWASLVFCAFIMLFGATCLTSPVEYPILSWTNTVYSALHPSKDRRAIDQEALEESIVREVTARAVYAPAPRTIFTRRPSCPTGARVGSGR
jgi:hypothetical protein